MTADSERQIRELLETRTRAFARRDAAAAAAGLREWISSLSLNIFHPP